LFAEHKRTVGNMFKGSYWNSNNVLTYHPDVSTFFEIREVAEAFITQIRQLNARKGVKIAILGCAVTHKLPSYAMVSRVFSLFSTTEMILTIPGVGEKTNVHVNGLGPCLVYVPKPSDVTKTCTIIAIRKASKVKSDHLTVLEVFEDHVVMEARDAVFEGKIVKDGSGGDGRGGYRVVETQYTRTMLYEEIPYQVIDAVSTLFKLRSDADFLTLIGEGNLGVSNVHLHGIVPRVLETWKPTVTSSGAGQISLSPLLDQGTTILQQLDSQRLMLEHLITPSLRALLERVPKIISFHPR